MADFTTLDFDTIKSNLKTYLQGQDIFTDYDFEGSNISVLLDILAYNTQLNAHYLNMIGAEMFLDTAILRDSVVSHVKELNYLPRSSRSAYANVSILVDVSGDSLPTTYSYPKGTTFTAKLNKKNYTFTTTENQFLTGTPVTIAGDPHMRYTLPNLLIHEGNYVTETFTSNDSDPIRYLISNPTIDTTSITVTITEDAGQTTLIYQQATSLYDLNEESKVFFLQPAEDNQYEIIFGDDVVGRKPKSGSLISITYRRCHGSEPNGAKKFIADSTILGTQPTIVVNVPARWGSEPESLESIKYNAPRAFTTQERAVTTADYETLLTANFADINTVAAYGGEESNPPRYGKVFISVDLNTSDELPPGRRDVFYRFLKERTPLSIDPVFVDPEYTYVEVVSNVKYDHRLTTLNQADLKTLITDAIIDFSDTYLNGFKKNLRYSKLLYAIDNAETSIVSNDTTLRVVKVIHPLIGVPSDYRIDLGVKLRDNIYILGPEHQSSDLNVVSSSAFIYKSKVCFLEDDGEGVLRIMTEENGNHILVRENIGTVNYENGFIELKSFSPALLQGTNSIKIYGQTDEKDISSERNVILSIVNSDITVNVKRVTIS